MKSATFLSFDPEFERVVSEVITARGGRVGDQQMELVEDGPDRGRFNFYGKTPADLDWEFRDPPWEAADGVTLPDMATVGGYYVECGWEQQFADVAKAIAEAASGPVWVMDSDGVVWDAAAVDPERIVL
ncbi:hypothetical protein [Actinotalea solisilvae]|uniref:hypothetical protein n=1 Tax=Actinotalea solisilvae TaxID=2072922 RepID=UPI0018F12891|nr:hypothetical protein [Actinotalea solisilvae]